MIDVAAGNLSTNATGTRNVDKKLKNFFLDVCPWMGVLDWPRTARLRRLGVHFKLNRYFKEEIKQPFTQEHHRCTRVEKPGEGVPDVF